MPQLDFYSYFSTSIYLVIVFISLFYILCTYLLPRIAESLKIRTRFELQEKDIVKKNIKVTDVIEPANIFVQQVSDQMKKLSNK